MAWTTPRTWVTDELVTAALMNTHVRDNLAALKDPPSDNYEANEGSDYTTTSATFGDVDATNFALTITTTGGDVLVGFTGSCVVSTAGDAIYLDIDVDGVRQGGDDGIILHRFNGGSGDQGPISFCYLVANLSAASHTFKLQFAVEDGATATIYAGAGTADRDIHPQFWAREVS